jgi:phosphoribosyl 1,2-cyclic phosphate phosphodiesterase
MAEHDHSAHNTSPAHFLFLGTGTSGGIPVIACDCAACTSDDPRDSRTRTAAAVRWVDDDGNDRAALIDAGPDLRLQALRHDLRRADAIFITHNHVDHIFGLDETRRFNVAMRAPIDVYAEARTWAALHRVYQHVFDKAANVNDSFIATLINHEIPDPDGANTTDPRTGRYPSESRGGAAPPIDIHAMRFTPIRLLHGRLPILGYRVEPVPGSGLEQRIADAAERADGRSPFPLAWCTDTSAIPPGTWSHLEGLSTLCLDGLRQRRHPTHMTLDEACHAAERIGAPRTWLIHVAHEVVHARDEPTLPDAVRLGIDGLVLHADGSLAIERAPGAHERMCWDAPRDHAGRAGHAAAPAPSEPDA